VIGKGKKISTLIRAFAFIVSIGSLVSLFVIGLRFTTNNFDVLDMLNFVTFLFWLVLTGFVAVTGCLPSKTNGSKNGI